MKTRYIFLALLVQFFVAATAHAWSPLDDSKAKVDGSQHCESYSLVPVQSQESENTENEEEEEPDCE